MRLLLQSKTEQGRPTERCSGEEGSPGKWFCSPYCSDTHLSSTAQMKFVLQYQDKFGLASLPEKHKKAGTGLLSRGQRRRFGIVDGVAVDLVH